MMVHGGEVARDAYAYRSATAPTAATDSQDALFEDADPDLPPDDPATLATPAAADTGAGAIDADSSDERTRAATQLQQDFERGVGKFKRGVEDLGRGVAHTLQMEPLAPLKSSDKVTPENIERVLREAQVLKTCEEMMEENRADLIKLNMDTTDAVNKCKAEHADIMRELKKRLLKDDMTVKTFKDVIRVNRRNLKASERDLEQKLKDELRGLDESVEPRKEAETWGQYFKRNAATLAGGAAAVGASAAWIATGGSVNKAVSGLAATGLIAYFWHYGINPVTWIMEKVKRAWRDPRWAAACIAKFNAVKRVVCRLLNTIVLGMTAYALGMTGGRADVYVDVGLQDIDRHTGGILCSTITTIVRGALTDPAALASVTSAATDLLAKGLPLAGMFAGIPPGVTSSISGVMGAMGGATSSMAPSVLEALMLERALTKQLESVIDLLDPTCAMRLIPNLLTIHHVTCHHMHSRRRRIKTRQLKEANGGADAKADINEGLIHKIQRWLWDAMVRTSPYICPAPVQFEMETFRRSSEADDMKSMLHSLDAKLGDAKNCLIFHMLEHPKPGKSHDVVPKQLQELADAMKRTQCNDPAKYAFFDVPSIDEVEVVGNDTAGNIYTIDVLVPKEFCRHNPLLPERLERYGWKQQDDVRHLPGTLWCLDLHKTLAYRRVQTLYAVNLALWSSKVWDGSTLDDWNAATTDPNTRARREGYVAWGASYISDTLSQVMGGVWQQSYAFVGKLLDSRAEPILGDAGLARNADIQDATAFATMVLERRERKLIEICEVCALHGDCQRLYALSEFVRALKLFTDVNDRTGHGRSDRSLSETAELSQEATEAITTLLGGVVRTADAAADAAADADLRAKANANRARFTHPDRSWAQALEGLPADVDVDVDADDDEDEKEHDEL